MTRNIFFWIVAMLLACSIMQASAQDKDHPAISRYQGAEFVASRVWDYVPYVLGTADQEQKEERFRGHSHYFADFIDLEGKLTRLQYRVDSSEGLFKVFSNYKNALKQAGYDILFTTSDNESSWPFWNEIVYAQEKGINAVRDNKFEDPFGRYGFRFITAKGAYKGNNAYIALFIQNSGDHIYITQDIVEVNPMESGLVSAQKIADQIQLSGFVSIYGIHFESGKWEINQESEEALKELATFLNNHEKNNYLIVGHTDNVGDLDANMALSQKRAKAVKQALTEGYDVKATQLKAYGVASLAPVTSNATEEGKARNRRVAIVEE